MNISTAAIITGLVVGMTYALLAAGLVLIFRTFRFINFAHGQIGAFSGLIVAKLVNDAGWSYWIAIAVAIAVAVAVGALVERLVMQPLAGNSTVVLMVASIGVAQLLYAMSFVPFLKPKPGTLVQQGYPTPMDWSWSVSGTVLRSGQLMILLVVPIIGVVMAAMFRSRFGLRLRAVSTNIEAARLAGVRVKALATQVWMIAGALSAVTAILLGPTRGALATETLGPGLLVRALTAALCGNMTSLPAALMAGVALGVVEQVTLTSTGSSGNTEMVMFGIMVVALVIRARGLRTGGRGEEDRLPTTTRTLAERRNIPLIAGAFVVASMLPFLPLLSSNRSAFILAETVVFAIAGLSVYVVVSWTGQLSLGQFAFVGLGAYVGARLSADFTAPFVLLTSGAVAALCAALIGLPVSRMRGLFLGVLTMGFAVAAPAWLFQQAIVTGEGSTSFMTAHAPILPFGIELDGARPIYLLSLATLGAILLLLAAVRSSSAGRRILAVRDNRRAAAAQGIPVATTNVAGFALAGFVAGVAGALWAYVHVNFDASAFGPSVSLQLFIMTVVGGLSSPVGAIIGAVNIIGIPLLIGIPTATALFIAGGALVVTVLTNPDGLIVPATQLRRWLERRTTEARVRAALPQPTKPDVVLEANDVTVRFGGLVALDAVTVKVRAGEIVGLIGTNGAGKTTLMDAISGYVRPAEGTIEVAGRDLSRLGPEFRSHAGVARTFQDARVFPGLTVRENVLVAAEHASGSGIVASALRLPWQRFAERSAAERADRVIEVLELQDVAGMPMEDMPTGRRRVCNLAVAVASEPILLLLDEPTAGLPRSELPMFAKRIRSLRDQLGCSILLIEHDMPLITACCDRVYALQAGRPLADGSPREVLDHPAVISAYLGEDVVAAPRRRREPIRAAGR